MRRIVELIGPAAEAAVEHEMWKLTCAALVSTALLLACSRPDNRIQSALAKCGKSWVVCRVGNAIDFRGEITPASEAEFARDIDGSTHTLVIASGGGDARSAIAMAQIIHRLGLRVIVNRMCWSACAQYVFMAGRQRRVEPHSLVIFHHTPSSIARLGRERPLEDSGTWQAWVDTTAKLGQQLYAELAIPTTLLYQPQIEIGTRCARYVRDSKGRVRDLATISEYKGWIPSRQMMTQWGVSFSGFWPTSLDTLKAAFARTFRLDRPVQITFGLRGHVMSAKELDAAYAKVGVCTKPLPPDFESHAPAWSNPYADHGVKAPAVPARP